MMAETHTSKYRSATMARKASQSAEKAARAGLSRRRFSDLFRAGKGCTFWEFLNEHRLEHAAKLLRTGNHSVTGVAFSCGFNDLSHFYRLFRGRFKQPPRAWLAQLGESGR